MFHILNYSLIVAALIALTKSEPIPIVNGVTAAPTVKKDGEILMPNTGQYPYMVSVESSEGLCGGVLLKRNIVLTAAHCTLGNKKLLVVAGSLDVQDVLSPQRKVKRIDHSDIHRHPKFKHLPSANSPYDVAILKIKSGFDLNKYINTIRLASGDYTNHKAFVLGWGSTKRNGKHSDLLLRGGLQIMSAEECKQAMNSNRELSESMLCAIHPERIQTTCRGDSGGPLIIPNGRGPQDDEIVGVVSWGENCNRFYPAVFTKINRVRSWIVETAEL